MSSLPPTRGTVGARVVCRVRAGQLQTFKLRQEESVIGREQGMAIAVPLEGVSRHHARILWDGKNHWLEDMRSTNGTFLNGQRVERERLRHLDVISLGKKIDMVFILRSEEQVVRKVGIVHAALVAESADALTHEIPMGEITLGRSAACNVQADSTPVSKVHARIERTADQLVLQDLGSSNGTFVNGSAVMTAALKDGDVVSLAGLDAFKVVIEMGEITSATGTRLPAYETPARTTVDEARPRFSAAWKTRFEWDSAELLELAELHNVVEAEAAEKTMLKRSARAPGQGLPEESGATAKPVPAGRPAPPKPASAPTVSPRPSGPPPKPAPSAVPAAKPVAAASVKPPPAPSLPPKAASPPVPSPAPAAKGAGSPATPAPTPAPPPPRVSVPPPVIAAPPKPVAPPAPAFPPRPPSVPPVVARPAEAAPPVVAAAGPPRPAVGAPGPPRPAPGAPGPPPPRPATVPPQRATTHPSPALPIIVDAPAPTLSMEAPPPEDTGPRPLAQVNLRAPGFDLVARDTGAHDIGRSSEAALRVVHATVSRRHARLILSDDRTTVYVQDMGGANGTRLNGRSVTGIEVVKEGDVIGLGEVELTVGFVRG